MKNILIVTTMVFAMGCATAQLEAQIDEQENLLLAKNKETKALEAELAERDAQVSELKSEMFEFQSKMSKLETSVSYMQDVEAENEDLKDKLQSKATAELGELLTAAEAVSEEPESKTEKSEPADKLESKVAAKPPMSMMPPMAGMGMPMGSPFMGSSMMMPTMQTFQSFPVSKLGYAYSPPPDNEFHIKLSAKWANDKTYFLVKVNGKEIIFSGEPPRVMKVGGKAVEKSLLPPGADGYIPVDSIGPYTVKVQGCRMNGSVCVPIKACKPRKMEDVTNSFFILYECD